MRKICYFVLFIGICTCSRDADASSKFIYHYSPQDISVSTGNEGTSIKVKGLDSKQLPGLPDVPVEHRQFALERGRIDSVSVTRDGAFRWYCP